MPTNLTVSERLHRVEMQLKARRREDTEEDEKERAARLSDLRKESKFSVGATVVFAVLAAGTLIAGLVLFAPGATPFPSLDDAIITNSEPIVVIGRDLDYLVTEVHLQPQDGPDSFPDGAHLIVGESASHQELEARGDPGEPGFVIAIPNSRANHVLSEWGASGSCVATRELSVSDLPEAARVVASNHFIVQFDGCERLSLDLAAAASETYLTNSYSTALRLPPIAYFDRSGAVTPPKQTEISNEEGTPSYSACHNTTVLLDTYQLEPTGWLGAHPANVLLPLLRTEAIYYGGTFERPQSWLVDERIPESRVIATCVSQGVGIDFDRPGAQVSKTRDQVLAGFLIGLASAFLIAGVEAAASWWRLRRRMKSEATHTPSDLTT